MCHRLQFQCGLCVVINLGAQPSKEWPDLIGVEVLPVNLKILFLVGHPNTPTKLILVIVHWNLDDSMNKKVAPFDDAEVFCQKTVRVFGQLISPMEWSGRTDVGQ